MSAESQTDLLAFAPLAIFVLAAVFAPLAAMKRRALVGWLRRVRAESG
jgi:hypothetical protein